MSQAALELRKQSRMSLTFTRHPSADDCDAALYQTLLKHHLALKSLEKEHKKHLEREKQLGDILNSLRSGYNPNYQDMAVLEAVRGWEYFAGLPHINDVKKDDEVTDEELGSDDEVLTFEDEDGTWNAEQLEKDLPDLLNTDYESLLIEHDKHIGAPADESLRESLTAAAVYSSSRTQSSMSAHTSRKQCCRSSRLYATAF